MGQIHGSGTGNFTNTMMVDSSIGSQQGRGFTDSYISSVSGVPLIQTSGINNISGTTNIHGNKSSDGLWYPIRLDSMTNSLTTIDFAPHEIHDGGHYFLGNFSALDSGAAVVFGVDTPIGSKYAHMFFDISAPKQFRIEEWENATYSGGQVATPRNNNRATGSDNSTLTVVMDPAVTDSGLMLLNQNFGLPDITPSKPGGGGMTAREDELILAPGSKYIWVLKSVEDGNIINYKGIWYESTDKS